MSRDYPIERNALVSSDAQNPSEPRCPRCGYALIGSVDQWREACPLNGRCSECGLDFLWRDVLNTRFNLPRWSVEYGSIVGLPWRAVRTLLKMLKPWRFWRELQMPHEPRWGRIAAFLLVLLPMWYAVLAVSAGVWTHEWSSAAGSAAARARPALIYAVQGTLKPWGEVSSGTAMPGQRVRAYKPLRVIHAGWKAARSGFSRLWRDDRPEVIAERGFTSLLVTVFCPAAFALLPATRRIARVRWRHIFRIGLYSGIVLIIPIGLDCYQQIAGVRGQWLSEVGTALALVVGLLLAVWWSCASRWHLRLRHPWVVGPAVVVLGYLSQRLILELIDLGLDLGG